MKSLYFRLDVQPNPATSVSAGDFVRILVIYDCQTNSTAPVVSDVLATAAYNSPMNLANRDRFKILMDKNVTMGANVYTGSTLTAGDPQPKIVKVFKRMNLETVFGDVDATVASMKTGSVYLLLINKTNTGSSSTLYSRIRFIDN